MDRLTRENRDLAGQVGYLQSKLQAAEARILALEAPHQNGATSLPAGRAWAYVWG